MTPERFSVQTVMQKGWPLVLGVCVVVCVLLCVCLNFFGNSEVLAGNSNAKSEKIRIFGGKFKCKVQT